MTFNELSLCDALLRAVQAMGYDEPSPIQQKAIPPVLAGRDLLGCAQTGTGKTAAFALPILQRLSATTPQGKRPIRTLVLTPTRELALQIQESFVSYGKHLPLRSAVIFGGVGQAPQVAALKRGVDILVATPGRLNDLIGQGYIKLDQLEIFVLDEADRMLDMGFVQDVKKVLRLLPKKRQTLLFSATMPKEIAELADSMLHEPAKVFVTPPATTVEKIEQHLYKVDKANKPRLLAHLLQDKSITSALVFTRTKHGADRVARDLKRKGIPALAIHGNKSQNARQAALAQFKDGKVRVLVATDIAARGLDINELSHVFNYDLPNVPETYVHRIGRTGRAGHDGIAISFCSHDEFDCLRDIEKLIGLHILEEDHSWPLQGPTKEDAVMKNHSADKQKQPQKQNRQGQKNEKQQTPPQKAQKPVTRQTGAPAAQGRPAGRRNAGAQGKNSRGGPPRQNQNNPYENRTGGNAIITKRPAWSSEAGTATPAVQEGDASMSRNNNRRRRGGKNRGGKSGENNQPNLGLRPEKKSPPPIKKNEKGIFDFSEDELAQDTALRLISDTPPGETKYASFEDYLKEH